MFDCRCLVTIHHLLNYTWRVTSHFTETSAFRKLTVTAMWCMTSSNPITGKKTGVHKTTTGFVKKTVLTFLIRIHQWFHNMETNSRHCTWKWKSHTTISQSVTGIKHKSFSAVLKLFIDSFSCKWNAANCSGYWFSTQVLRDRVCYSHVDHPKNSETTSALI